MSQPGTQHGSATAAVMKVCFPCHELIKVRDDVFTRYAP